MSLPWRDSPGIALLAPVSTGPQALQAAAAGARLVDAGPDGALVPVIRRAASGILICGDHETADVTWDAARAERTGAALICPDRDAAAAAAGRGIEAERILVRAAPAGIEAAARAGWTVLADLEGLADQEGPGDVEGLADLEGLAGLEWLADLEGLAGRGELAGRAVRAGALARTEAIAAVCAWLGARVLRTRHVAEIRRCADMTESILGRRPPAWAVRGLA